MWRSAVWDWLMLATGLTLLVLTAHSEWTGDVEPTDIFRWACVGYLTFVGSQRLLTRRKEPEPAPADRGITDR